MAVIEFGMQAKDVVTGFEGIVTSKTEWITGCTTYCLSPGVDKDGKHLECRWFDEPRIEIVSSYIIKLPDHGKNMKKKKKKGIMETFRKTGGGTPPEQQREDPPAR